MKLHYTVVKMLNEEPIAALGAIVLGALFGLLVMMAVEALLKG